MSASHPDPQAVTESFFERPDLDRIYRREAPGLARYFRRHLRASDDVRDLVQEAFVRLAGARPRGGWHNPEGYLQRIARNLLFSRPGPADLATAARAPMEEGLDAAVRAEQEDAIHCRDAMGRYRIALGMLTPRTREVFLLHRVDELSYKAIAARLRISVSTVEYHIAKAIVVIGEAMERE